ncbi:hypothetical protein C1646_755774, partial [Rhizophagus diaphanus]
RSFQKPRKRKKVPCYCNNCNGKLVLERTKLLHETGGETNDLNEDESNITENIELPQVNVDVHQTSTSGRVRYTSHPMPQSTSLNIESDVYNASKQNTEMSLGSKSNNESYNEIFEDYSPPSY